MTRDEAIDKVRKLLALAEGEGATTGEAANAAAAATALMERYRLASAEVAVAAEDDEAIAEGTLLVEGLRLDGWIRFLLVAVAKTNSCRSLLQSHVGGKKSLRIIGRPSDSAVAQYTFAYLRREIDRLADEHRGAGRSYLNAFRIGAVSEVSKRLSQAKTEARVGATSTAIVRVDARGEEVGAWLEARGTKPTTIRTRAPDAEGYAAGRRAGAEIPLSPAIEGGNTKPAASLPKHHDPGVFDFPGGGES